MGGLPNVTVEKPFARRNLPQSAQKTIKMWLEGPKSDGFLALLSHFLVIVFEK